MSKSNGKITPMDDDTVNRLGKEMIDSVKTTEGQSKKSFFQRCFKRKEEKPVEEKKPKARKLKMFEIVGTEQETNLFNIL